MNTRSPKPGACVLAALFLLCASHAPEHAAAQDTGASDPLTAFGARMVGTWEGTDSRHVFEWGVGGRVIKSTSYAASEGEWAVVSEGWWYWDPAAHSVRGTTIAIGMGIELFEHTSRIEGDEIVHDLTTHGPLGGSFVERWTFDDDGYSWQLEQDGARIMGGRYRRVR